MINVLQTAALIAWNWLLDNWGGRRSIASLLSAHAFLICGMGYLIGMGSLPNCYSQAGLHTTHVIYSINHQLKSLHFIFLTISCHYLLWSAPLQATKGLKKGNQIPDFSLFSTSTVAIKFKGKNPSWFFFADKVSFNFQSFEFFLYFQSHHACHKARTRYHFIVNFFKRSKKGQVLWFFLFWTIFIVV